MPTPASVADSPRSAAARAAREQPVGTPAEGANEPSCSSPRDRLDRLAGTRGRRRAVTPVKRLGGAGAARGVPTPEGSPDQTWGLRGQSAPPPCRSAGPGLRAKGGRRERRRDARRSGKGGLRQARPITSAAASSRRFGSRGSAGRRFWVVRSSTDLRRGRRFRFHVVSCLLATPSAGAHCSVADLRFFGRQLDRARRGGREYESDRRWMRAFRAKRARRRAAGQKPRSPIAGLCRPRVPWRLAEERTGIRVAAWPTNAASRYSVPLCVASSLGERSAGAGTRRSSWSINAPQRSGSSRNGAWRPGMTSRRASGRSAHARWPISGPP